MSRHAYLILAHNEPDLLSRLVSCLDDPRNDIFIHWDRKSGNLPEVQAEKSGLFFTDERIDVRWGGFSMVEAEYLLFEAAAGKGPYQYYHLISGVDLPIKSQDYIHGFCDSHEGIEFVAFADASADELRYRFNHYFLFPEDYKSGNMFKRGLRLSCLKVQDLFRLRRHADVRARKGSQWCSLTHDFIMYLIARKEYVRETFNHTFCPDEMFIQTLCYNSGFYDRCNKSDEEFDGNLRFIKWVDGELLKINDTDLTDITSSCRWFARKFSGTDIELVENVIGLTR